VNALQTSMPRYFVCMVEETCSGKSYNRCETLHKSLHTLGRKIGRKIDQAASRRFHIQASIVRERQASDNSAGSHVCHTS
jgi:hypothetical protein